METEIHAAARELEEETGLVFTNADLVEFPDNFYTSQLLNRKDQSEREKIYSWRVFLCTSYSGELHNSSETTPQWVNINKLQDFYLLPNVKNAADAGLKFKNINNI